MTKSLCVLQHEEDFLDFENAFKNIARHVDEELFEF